MCCDWLRAVRKYALGACAGLALSASVCRAADDDAEIRAQIEQQAKEIEMLRNRLDAAANNGGAGQPNGEVPPPPAKVEIEEGALRKIVADYLSDNPGAGMPSGVQAGWYPNQGFTIRSAPSPRFVNWNDECKIPFELRFRGRVQLDYYMYQPTDNLNHQTGLHYAPAAGTLSNLLVKRARFAFFGTAFSPDLRYWLELDGNTRGISGFQANKVAVSTTPPAGSGLGAPGVGTAGSAIGNSVLVDNTVRLFSAYVAYDWHPPTGSAGCGPDCGADKPKYTPTISFIAGKFKPLFAFEEYMGSGNEQFVEYGITNWFFDADDDNLLMAAGIQVRAFDDRLWFSALVTNGNESQFAVSQMDELPGINVGGWYDFGGNWDRERKAWNLFGDSISDIDYSCCPVFRVGAGLNYVPMDRASIYGDVEQSRVRVMGDGPNGTSLIGMLNGGGLAGANQGGHAVDAFDEMTYETYFAGKYRGFSFYTGAFIHSLYDFRPPPNGNGHIVYSTNVGGVAGGTTNALLNVNSMIDYGTQVQCGYFIVPRRLEVAARWCWIRGESGDINGDGKTLATTTIPTIGGGAATPVRIVDRAFREFSEADEYTVGLNYYFKRQQLKWQTDLGYYRGGNPAGGGASPAGYIAGVDGWLLRTQIQLWF